MVPSWDPKTYLRFADERARPYVELVDRIPLEAPARVVDLGCGPGTTTAELLDRWPTANVVGLDRSPAMIAAARSRASERLTFVEADLATWEPAPDSLDVIIANAVLHWVPDHAAHFKGWLAALRPGGSLAFQVPANFDAPSHQILYRLAGSSPWRDRLANLVGTAHSLPAAAYWRALHALGATLDLWETTYYQVLTGPDPVLAWMEGSALRPFLQGLPPAERPVFTRAYAEELRQAYPPEPGGETLFAFRRVFVVATRPGRLGTGG